jgi:hypothetical protein
MTAVREIERENAVMNVHNGGIGVQVGRRAREGLDVDTPFLGAKVEGLERTLLAKTLCLVDVLVSSIVSLARVTFRVLVLHNTTQRIENSLRREVLRGNQVNEVLLALLLL